MATLMTTKYLHGNCFLIIFDPTRFAVALIASSSLGDKSSLLPVPGIKFGVALNSASS